MADGTDGFAFRDVTGQLAPADTAALADHRAGQAKETAAYLARMATYETNVDARYAGFLAEIGQVEAEDLHAVILSTVISGNMTPLCAWLDQRYGPGAFAALFMSPGYLSLGGPPDHTGLTLAS
ncbi:hypothetical protein AB0H73_33260 [Streptomyces olivoreticuli]